MGWRFTAGLLALCSLIWCSCGDSMPTARNDEPAPTNRPPVIDAMSDTFAVVGDTLELWVHACDPDGDDVAYGFDAAVLPGGPPEAAIDSLTGHFWYVPRRIDKPARLFWFIAADTRGASAWVHAVVSVVE